MISTKKVANAVGGKTARACDSCIKKRARWYCAADDAFLCQACDASVHSANPLARRHERVRLKTASLKHPGSRHPEDSSAPSWHHGFTRKARTPRHGSKDSIIKNRQMGKPQESRRNPPVPLVPEVGNSDEMSHEENEEDQLLYRVPIFDPFVAELCTSATSNEAAVSTVATDTEAGDVAGNGSKALPPGYGQDVDSLHGFLPSDMDLAEFAADVETMLGRGLENGSFCMEELGLVDCRDKEMRDCSLEGGGISSEVKIEEEDTHEAGSECKVEAEIEMTREPFEFSFDYDSHANWEEEDEKVFKGEVDMKDSTSACEEEYGRRKKKRKLLLRLDYEAVISAWTSHQSPWTTGDRPDFNPDECWPDCLSSSGTEVHHPYAEMAGIGMYPTLVDVGREARVSRYREKRRTRLFSKKIRYEVRKLNAEKRPRMKGRFVKRASFAAPAFPLLTSK